MTVATQSIFTTFRCRDAAAQIDFLERALGFERGMVVEGPDGAIHHAELRFGGEWICVEDMGLAGATIVALVQVWAERSA